MCVGGGGGVGGEVCVGMYISACYVQIYLCTLQFTFSQMCQGVGTASQSMTESVSLVCQKLQSYFFMYFVIVVVANTEIVTFFLSF